MRVEINPTKGREGNFTIIPHGSIDSDTYQEFQTKINPVLTKTAKNVLLNLGDVDYISSAGLGVLFSLKKFLQGNGGQLLFCNLKPQIHKLFEVVKALPKESIFESVEQVDEYLYKIMNEEIEKNKKSGF